MSIALSTRAPGSDNPSQDLSFSGGFTTAQATGALRITAIDVSAFQGCLRRLGESVCVRKHAAQRLLHQVGKKNVKEVPGLFDEHDSLTHCAH